MYRIQAFRRVVGLFDELRELERDRSGVRHAVETLRTTSTLGHVPVGTLRAF